MQFNSFSVFTGTLLLAVSPIFAAGSLDNADGVEQTLVTASRAPLALNRVGNATTVGDFTAIVIVVPVGDAPVFTAPTEFAPPFGGAGTPVTLFGDNFDSIKSIHVADNNVPGSTSSAYCNIYHWLH